MTNAVQKIYEVVNPLKNEFEQVCSEPSITFKRESEFAMQIFANNDYLANVAVNNLVSVRSAIMNVSAIGISLNPAQKLAYLVPRDKKVCLDISYMGLMHIAQQSQAIKWCQSSIVRQNDNFQLTSIDTAPRHEYNAFATQEQRGEIVGAYTVVKTEDGDYLTHTMAIADIYAIRDRSTAWKAWISKKKSCPWVTDEEQMILKTVVKQAAKYWPRRERLDKAIDYVNTEAGEGIDFGSEQQEPKDITPASEDQLKVITDLMIKVNGEWSDTFFAFISKKFNHQISHPEQLTAFEANTIIDMLRKKAEGK
ncbi:recombinase RecT [Proteus mirabilis]|uniref:recombinase RecT n=1 Tax=Proteus mirabilis TaxID=584 RepID=UPI0021BB860E|nr:RecT family recombinase [Proteus mirabilis]MCT8197323.1 recombinase RecT [Proteus mirabilis]MDK6999242.1 RecT family recombinase [Proteus mirabilis]MDK7017178.1 RecT family recombinase [Proteus mirabilis]MDK8618997.1 RecT family recombinase [Proteus mirabilis]HEK1878107.1 recombinase RecT [Proteus mirabilis]